MRKFLHLLEKGKEPDTYLVCGRLWDGFGHSEWDTLHLRGGNVSVETEFRGDGCTWKYCLQLADSVEGRPVYFRHTGTATTIQDACVAAIAYEPERLTLEYLGETFECYGSPRSDAKLWVFAVNGEKAEVYGPHMTHDKAEYFTWHRSCIHMQEMLERFTNGELQGRAPTQHAAMVAAIDAPELFKRACASMISSLTGGAQ